MNRLPPELLGLALGVALSAAVWALADAGAEPVPPPATTTTSSPPFCDVDGARVYPGTGIIEAHHECPQPPPLHAPAGTGPTTAVDGSPPDDD